MKIISKGKPVSQINLFALTRKGADPQGHPQGRNDRRHHEVDRLGEVRRIVAIATNIVPLGYKVTLDEGVYTVKLPKGMKKPLIKELS